jgi:hypothetical protein
MERALSDKLYVPGDGRRPNLISVQFVGMGRRHNQEVRPEEKLGCGST